MEINWCITLRICYLPLYTISSIEMGKDLGYLNKYFLWFVTILLGLTYDNTSKAIWDKRY
jgi:hypothetical protein